MAGFERELAAVADNPVTLYGHRTPRLFGTVVADLERDALIKEEDAGELLTSGLELQAPEYRPVMADGTSLLVEVKNYRPADPRRPFRMRSA